MKMTDEDNKSNTGVDQDPKNNDMSHDSSQQGKQESTKPQSSSVNSYYCRTNYDNSRNYYF